MKELSNEQTEYAVTRLQRMVESRGLTQPELSALSKVSQSAISKIFARNIIPSTEQLTKLFQALGLKLHDVLELDAEPEYLYGYLATPLTGIASDPPLDSALRSVVQKIKEVAADPEFKNPPFDLYWPGDHTHPTNNADIPAAAVYLTDRSLASTNDFVLMFCGSPSFGVGQENEIATQAGIPIIRMIPGNVSRMLSGSFAEATNIRYVGSLKDGIQFDEGALKGALQQIRVTYYHHRALYRSLNGRDFGERLRRLIDDRVGDHRQFAKDLGIGLSYLVALLGEQLTVANPSTRLLKRMAARLDVSVSYLLGEVAETDPVWLESHNTLRSWVEKDRGLSAAIVMEVRDEWRKQYRLNRPQASVASFRNKTTQAMREVDWDRMYKDRAKKTGANATGTLFK
jgi:transcriptional regulator with XRE-family HTH domain